MTSLAALRDEVNTEIQTNPGFKISSSSLIDKNINRALSRLSRDLDHSLPFFREVYEFTTVSGQKTYDLPTDFAKLQSPVFVQVGNSMLRPAAEQDIERYYTQTTSLSGSMYFYITYSDGWKINFSPSPTGGKAVKIIYTKNLPSLTDVVDSPLPTEFDELLIHYAVYLTMRRLRGGEAKAADYYNEYTDLLPAIKHKFRTVNPEAFYYGGVQGPSYNFNIANPFDKYA